MTAALNGDVQGMFGSVALVAPHVRAGKLKALATTGPPARACCPRSRPDRTRPASLAFTAWFGLVAPAATPGPVQAELEAAVLRALSAAPVRAKMQEAGFRVAGNGRAAFAALIRDETARWAEVVRSTGFKAIE
jgi:tripartite-type tricarboxylate transporter receptor subunit TctC